MGIYRGGTDILKFVTAGTDAVTIDANQQVGIGTSSPSYPLEIGDGSDSVKYLQIKTTNTGVGALLFGDSDANDRARVEYSHFDNSLRFKTNGANERMRIDSSGRVMIGTTTEGEANGDDLTIATTGATGITIRSGTSSDGHLFFSDGTSGADEYRGYLQYNHQHNRLAFGTDATERMRIDSSGNVGIGTSSPSGAAGTTLAINGASGQSRLALKNTSTGDASGDGFQLSIGTDGSVGIEQRENNYMALYTNATERMRITSAGNVGIGTSSPATKLDVLGDNLVGTFAGTDTASAYISFKYNTSTLSAFIGNGSSVLSGANNSDFIIRSQGDLVFASNGNNRRVTIDTSGNLMMGKTSISNAVGGIRFSPAQEMIIGRDGTSAHDMIDFYRGVSGSLGRVGNIRTQDSSTSYNTSSDYRLKENVNYTFDATTRLKQLRPARFNFIVNADVTVDGFLAHEVQSVVPEAITGTYNEVDADGNPVYQGIDQSKLVPLLVKTIQELEARITALENGE